MINSPDTASLIDYGFDDPARLEHIDRLRDKGYAVYFGELAVEAETSSHGAQDQYYALLVPLDEHQERLNQNPVNNIKKAAHALTQIRRTFYWLEEEPLTSVQRFTDEEVLSDPNLRKAGSAWRALVEAEKVVEGTESKDIVKMSFMRQARLRQAQNQHHK